jgi:uncharacterized protein
MVMGQVTRALSVEGNVSRTIVGRLLPGTDMLNGIMAVCQQHRVKYGFISCAIGAFVEATFMYPIPKEGAKVGIVYSDPVTLKGPIEFLGGQGVIGQSEQGEYRIHLHGSASDKEMRVWGGHFVPGGNIVLATLDFIIQEVSGLEMLRKFDDETGFEQFVPKKTEE